MLNWIRPLVVVPILALSAPVMAADFDDRDRLAEILTLDEQAPLADAEESLAEYAGNLDEAKSELATVQDAYEGLAGAAAAAQQRADEAGDALAAAIEDGVMGEELAALEQGAISALDAAVAAADAAAGAKSDLDGAQAKVDGHQADYDAASTRVEGILAEIDGTSDFVASLDDEQARALNRSLHNAVASGLLPLDIDLDVLARILEEGLANGEIQQLTHAFEMEARFERLAARFDAKGDRFDAQAERARAKGASSKERFLCRIGNSDCGDADGDDGSSEPPVRDKARDGSGDAVSLDGDVVDVPDRDKSRDEATDAANERARSAVGEAMRDVARIGLKSEARKVARAAAREAVEDVRNENRGRGLAKGQDK